MAHGHRMFSSCMSIDRESVGSHYHLEMILPCSPYHRLLQNEDIAENLAEVRCQLKAANNLTSMIRFRTLRSGQAMVES